MSRAMRVVLATSNRGKLGDFRLLFRGSGVELTLPEELGLGMDVEEDGETFEDNALLKARAIGDNVDEPVMADDSGLEVRALGGAPGVLSARYSGPDCDDHANNLKLIEELRGHSDRRAAFVCALALVFPDGQEIVTHGRCEGSIIDEERGSNGFGYDALFFRDDLGCTFGQASADEKNQRSHRAAAVRAMLAELMTRGLL
ncbi:MAG: RdgB/HAM1 family non-canonical purine NTP pyrophosphatase [Candidatus Binatia bacterium]